MQAGNRQVGKLQIYAKIIQGTNKQSQNDKWIAKMEKSKVLWRGKAVSTVFLGPYDTLHYKARY